MADLHVHLRLSMRLRWTGAPSRDAARPLHSSPCACSPVGRETPDSGSWALNFNARLHFSCILNRHDQLLTLVKFFDYLAEKAILEGLLGKSYR